ncbi:hypothetical protein [Clostridium sp. DL1XJH146]
MDFKKMAFDKIKDVAEDKMDDFQIGDFDVEEIINDDFVSKFTNLENVQEMIEKSGFDLEKIGDMTNLPLDKVNDYIKKISEFGSWEDLLKEAAGEFMKKKVGF